MIPTQFRSSIVLFACAIIYAASAGAQTKTVFYAPSTADFPNPERGFYSHREVQAEGQGLTLTDLKNVRAKNQSLILRMYYLKKFRTSDLSATQLNLMGSDFAMMRSAGVKCILRFAYSSSETEADAPLSTVLRHLDQLKPLLEANSDVIAVVQAGFIGAWGEWYYSTNGLNNTGDRRTVLTKVLEVLPKNWTVQVRTPNYKEEIFLRTDPLSTAEAFSGTDYSRTAHHNDCFLASADDYGTYQDTAVDKIFLSLDTRFTAMGGETCNLSEFCPCSNALLELARMHWSFLNSDYNSTVLNTWVSGGCMEEVKRRLGYRFELVEGAYKDSVKPGGAFTFQVKLTNSGWASPYNPRRVEVMLRRLADSAVYVAQLAEEPRFWFAGDTVTLSADIGVPVGMPLGSYALFLNLDDPLPSLRQRPEYSVRLANDSVWEAATGYNSLRCTVVIDPSASGGASTDTLQFRPLTPVTGVRQKPTGSIPRSPLLLGNYPNPFNTQTVIAYSLPTREYVVLRLHNILGQEVMRLTDSVQEAGRHELYVDAKDLSSGVYIYSLQAGSGHESSRLLLIK